MNIKKVTEINFSQIVAESAKAILNGGLVIAPFDTVYGIICDPKNEAAIKKIYEFKGREFTKTIGIAADKPERLELIAQLKNAEFIAERVPGPYTFILPAAKKVFSEFCYKDNSLAIRIPDSKLILEIAGASGGFLAQTSANKAGETNCLSIQEISRQFNENELAAIDVIIDGGKIQSIGPSEIWSLLGEAPQKIER